MATSASALRAGQATIELSLLKDRFERELSGVGKRVSFGFAPLMAQVGGFRNALSKLSSIQFPWLSAMKGLFVGAGVAGAIGFPVKMAASLEVATAQLAVFAGGTAKAKSMLMELQEFAGVAMVSFESLARNSAMMLRMGDAVEDVNIHTKALAVLAAGSEEEFDKLALAFGQVASAGRLQGEEMRQFKNTAFNPLREIAERTGETMDQVKKRMEDGAVSFTEVASALQAAVGPGGRFNGLLAAVSKTLSGLTNQVLAKFKLAILPLGQQLLDPLKNLMKALLGLDGPFKRFVASNAGAIKVVLGVALAIGLLAAGFLAFTAIMAVLSMAVAALATAIGTVAAVFALLFNPISLVAILVGELIASFLLGTEAGRDMVNKLGNYFMGLAAIAKEAFGGIVDALKAGDLALAGQVAMAGLNLAWLQGIDSIRMAWINFSNEFMRLLSTLGAKIVQTWQTISANSAAAVKNAALDILSEVLMFGKSDEEKKVIAQFREAAKIGVGNQAAGETSAAQAQFDAAMKAITLLFDASKANDIAEAQKQLQDAKNALDELAKKAADAAAAMPADKEWFGAGKFLASASDGFEKAKHAMKPEALFDTRLARQMLGGPQDQELEQLKIIAKNTGRRGGLPVI